MKPPDLTEHWLFDRITGVPLRTKIVGMVLGAVLLIGLVMTVTVRTRLATDLTRGLEERGVAIARYVAARSADMVLTDDTFGLYQLVRDTLENNLDVRYVFILDAQGQPLVYSFPQTVPPALLRLNPVPAGESHRLQPFDSDEGRMLDIAVSILDGRAGVVRLGFSLQRLQAEVWRATWELLGITALALVIASAIALFLTRVLTQPVLDLVSVTRRLEEGDLTARARPFMRDEVGELAQAFNAMADSLQASHQKLVQRVRELVILNAIANAISSTLDLREMLQAALARVLSELDLQAGWVFLEDVNSPNGLQLAAQSGLSQAFARQEATRELGDCVCAHVLHAGRPMVVDDICNQCRRLDRQLVLGEGLTCHASVPLVSRNRVIGVLNVASRDARPFSEEDLALLDSIGRQIGVAAENARLWEEVKEKEALRGQLLEKIITAQEEERQRLARELHDEAGQALTSLRFGLRNLERAASPAEMQERLQALRDLVGEIQETLHDLALELHPPALDELGLDVALRNFAAQYARHTGIQVEFQTIGMGAEDSLHRPIIPPQTAVTAYRLVQEALTNAARHAQANRVSILLECQENQMIVIVDDDGKGFNAQAALDQRRGADGHLGIRSM
ncbi:MAG: HAMP domain-containing protein [Anaerolineae bacterium]|nr:MAG: HAMP domain-containing protein [Anaerolineae bacterium]